MIVCKFYIVSWKLGTRRRRG